MVNTLVFPNARSTPKVNKTWAILINDVVFQTYIGINPDEALARQTVRLNLRCQVSMPVPDDKNYHEITRWLNANRKQIARHGKWNVKTVRKILLREDDK